MAISGLIRVIELTIPFGYSQVLTLTEQATPNRITRMKTRDCFAALLIPTLLTTTATWAHGPLGQDDHHHPNHDVTAAEAPAGASGTAAKVTGQNGMVFSWDEGLTAAFPEAAKEHEHKMHGGFNEDPETGILYTGITGYGLCSISADLKTWKKIGSDAVLAENVHGIVFFKHNGQKFLALAQNGKQQVVITDIDGNVKQILGKPTGDDFEFAAAKEWYSNENPHFAVTDVTYYKGTLYAVTGYSRGDFVLTAQEKDGKWAWGPLAWGGRGKEPGQFQTAHGVFALNDHIYVANRAAQQVVQFKPDGTFVRLFDDIPEKSLVCNVAHTGDHFILCPLKPIGEQKTAPIYAHSGDKLVSTLIPGDLGIPVLKHIHHAWPHWVKDGKGNKQLYILVHGWNKGKYAVLKQQ